MDANRLTFKQQKFCNEYLVSFNAYQAALLAGYTENTARKAEILHVPLVQTYLREVMNKAAARAEITHGLLLNEYRKIAFANMGNYFDYRGDHKRMCELTDDEKAALSHYHIANITDKDGFIRGEVRNIKLHNKMAALDRIARHLNFFNVPNKVSATVPEEVEPDTTEDDAFEAGLEGDVGSQMSEFGGERSGSEDEIAVSGSSEWQGVVGDGSDITGDGGLPDGRVSPMHRDASRENSLTLSPLLEQEAGSIKPEAFKRVDAEGVPSFGVATAHEENMLTLSPLSENAINGTRPGGSGKERISAGAIAFTQSVSSR